MPLLPRSVIALGLSAFFLIGLEQALFGPAFAALRERFVVSQGEVGNIVTAHFLGVTLGTVFSGVLFSRAGVRLGALLSSVACALGLSALALVGEWPLALAGAALSGLGFGGISGGFNTVFSGLGRAGAPLLSVLNATWGVGSVAAPLLATGVLERGLAAYFGLAASLFGLLALGSLLAPTRTVSSAQGAADGAAGRSKRLIVLFMVMLFLYSGVEVAASSWMVSYLRPTLGQDRASLVNSLFWVMLTVGRFGAAALSVRFLPQHLLLAAAALAVLLGLSSTVPALAPYTLVLLGLACAPIFPSGLAWFSSALPQFRSWTPYVIACSSFGAALVPALVGAGVGVAGLSSVPWTLSAAAGALLMTALFGARLFPAQGRLEGEERRRARVKE